MRWGLGDVGHFSLALCLSLVAWTISGLLTAHLLLLRELHYINHTLFCCLEIPKRLNHIKTSTKSDLHLHRPPQLRHKQAPLPSLQQAALAQRTPSVLAPWGQTKSHHVGDKHPGISWADGCIHLSVQLWWCVQRTYRWHRRHRFGGSIGGYAVICLESSCGFE